MTSSATKKFGLFSIVLLGINAIIGSGIFLIPNKVAAKVGNASLWVILFDAFLVMTLALCFAEMATRFKRNGGAYLYTKAAFGDFVGFEVGILKWVISLTSWAALSVAFATVLGQVIPSLSSPFMLKTIALSSIAILTLLNLRGVQASEVANNLLTISKLVPLIFLVAIGVFFIKFDYIVPSSPLNVSGGEFASAVIIMFYAFTGFESLSIAAADMENPEKNIPKTIVIVMLFVSVFYLAIQAVVSGVLGPELANSKAPLADALGLAVGNWGKQLILIGSVISIGGINLAISFLTPRLAQSLAEDGNLPKALAKYNSSGVPVYAVLVSAALVIPLALTGSFAKIAAINVVVRFSQYIPTCLAVLVLRKKHGPAPGFQVPFGPVIPLIAIVVSIWLLINSPTDRLIIGAGALVAGAVLYGVLQMRNKTV